MAMIEGIGDEVTFTLLAFVVVLLLTFAWFSTHVHDDPWFRIIILDRRRLQEFLAWLRARHPGTVRVQEIHGPGQIPPGDRDTSRNATDPSEQSLAGDHVTDPTVDVAPPILSDTAVSNGGGIPPPASTGTTFKTQSNIPDSSPEAVELPRLFEAKPPSHLSQNQRSEAADDAVSDVTSSCPNNQTVQTETQASSDSPGLANPATSIEDSQSHSEPRERNISAESSSSQEITSESSRQSDAPGSGSSQDSSGETLTGSFSATPSDSTEASRQTASAREEEVEEEASQAGQIRIKLKYLDERQRLVMARPQDTIGDFKRKHFATELAEDMMVRFVFRGQELRRDSVSLATYHVEDNCVIHCLLNRVHRTESTDAQHRGALDLDIGTLMFPLFGFILALIWYCRFSYKQYFNAVSTLALMGITFLYLVAAMAAYRQGTTHEHED